MSGFELSHYSLDAVGIGKSYCLGKSAFCVLDGFNLSLAPGKIGMLMGPSGCGKTTLLMILGGILLPDKGVCRVLAQDLFAMAPPAKIAFRARHISFLFQHLHLFPALTALENVALPLLIDGMHKIAALAAAKRLMIELGLEIHINSSLDVLSGGQKQRIAIGRALIRAPTLILCDEPTSNLDEDSAHLVFNLILGYARLRGCTFVISTHDNRITQYADQIVLFKGLNNYQMVQTGEVQI